MRWRYKILPLMLAVLSVPFFVHADRAQELQAQIDQRNDQIKQLEKEIQQYQKSLDATAKQSNTLQGEVNTINTTIKKLDADIRLTEAKIAKTQQTIKQLQLEIGEKDSSIIDNKTSLSESLRLLEESERASLLEQLASQQSLADFWIDQEHLSNLQDKVIKDMASLRNLRANLVDRKTETEREKKKLVALTSQLADQKKIADSNRQTKNVLLAQTKNQEIGYRQLLADRQAKKEAFEKELFQFESQLKFELDKSKLPSGKGVLTWPLDNVFITQYFGKTTDSVRLYTSGTHNGIDFRAAIGTPVKSAGSGRVVAAGNTDSQPGCYSYGKWILIDHQNGLSSLYGHLSLTKVAAGDSVAPGQLIGYSGNTGYSTGPHLHLTVFASDGVKVERYVNSINCKNVLIPIANPKAYLDPMVYL